MAIEFVGGAITSKDGASSGNSTMALNSGLSGGIASSVSDGDLVIAVFAAGTTNTTTLVITDGASDYTLIGSQLWSNDNSDTVLRVAYKFVSGDTSVTFGPTNAIQWGGSMAVYVFRGVDQTTPFDVAVQQATGQNSVLANPPSITPVTEGAFIVVIGAGGHNVGEQTYTTSGLTDFLTVGRNESTESTLGIGHKPDWVSGAFDPVAFGFSTSDSTAFSWAATTIALRPVGAAAYDLVADASSFAFTGTAASLEYGREVAAGGDSYNVNGTAANLELGREVIAATTAFNITGTTTALEHGREVTADSASLVITGTAADLTILAARELSAEAGSFTVSATAAALEYNRDFSAAAAAFAVTGTAIDLEHGQEVLATSATFTISGQAASLEHNNELLVSAATFTITGQDVLLGGSRTIEAAASSFTITGTTAALTVAERPGPIFVGGVATATEGTLSLTSLTGGTDTAPAEGDIVFVAIFSRDTTDIDITLSGYTEVSDLYANATFGADCNFAVFYKVMGSSPDTSITVPDLNGTKAAVYVLRAYDPAIVDATATTVTNASSGIPNPASITTTTDNALVLIFSGTLTDGAWTVPSGYGDVVSVADDGGSILIASKVVTTPGAEDPAAWSSVNSGSLQACASVTFALRAREGLAVIAGTGSYIVSGQAIDIIYDQILGAATTFFDFSPEAAGLEVARDVVAGGASYSISAAAVDFNLTRSIVASAAAFTVTGSAATLSTAAVLSATSATFNVTAPEAVLQYGSDLVIESTSYALTGSAAGLGYGRVTEIESIVFDITAGEITFVNGDLFTVEGTSFSVTGTTLDLFHNVEVQADETTFVVTGSDASLQTDNIEFLLETTSFAISPADAEITLDRQFSAESATFTVSAQDLTFILGYAVLGEEAQFEVTASDLELRKTQSLIMSPTGFNVTTVSAALLKLAAASSDVTKLYTKGRGKKRFWNAARARDLRDRGW